MRTFFRAILLTGALVLSLSLGAAIPSTQAYQCSCECGDGGSALGIEVPGTACSAGVCSIAVCNTACNAGDQRGATVAGTCLADDTSGAANCIDWARSRPMSSRRLAQLDAQVTAINTVQHTQNFNWTCQGIEGGAINNDKCIAGGCTGAGSFCCVPGSGSAPVGSTNPGSTGPTGTGTPPPPGENCTDVSIRAGTPTSTIETIATRVGALRPVWACQQTCTAVQRESCVPRGCEGGSTVLCCPPNTGIPVGQQCGGRGAAGGADGTGAAGSGSGSSGFGIDTLLLPECATTRDPARAGKCQIADVFELGYSAVKFMFGLAGALLLAAFVVAGFKYLVNGQAGKIQEAKDTMLNATFGMAIMLFAYILVKFLYDSLRN